jgi:prepilin signal peptidase PulO-like enzyme (type II secretory pathway)
MSNQSARKKRPELSILKGRSQCVNCEHTLAAKDLVPVFSWLSLKGKCRYCKKPISYHYPAVELLMASLFVISYSFWPYGLTGTYWSGFIAWLVAIVILVALLVYDARWMLLPNRLVAVATISSLATVTLLTLSMQDMSYLALSFVSGALLF